MTIGGGQSLLIRTRNEPIDGHLIGVVSLLATASSLSSLGGSPLDRGESRQITRDDERTTSRRGDRIMG